MVLFTPTFKTHNSKVIKKKNEIFKNDIIIFTAHSSVKNEIVVNIVGTGNKPVKALVIDLWLNILQKYI